jgi:cytochrome P450
MLRDRVEASSSDLLTAMQRRHRMDVIAEMLGVPAEQQHRFHRWSQSIVAANHSEWSTLRAIPNVMAFIRYISRLIALKRARPADDLVTAVVTAHESDDRLNDDELLSMIFLLLIAGPRNDGEPDRQRRAGPAATSV